MKKKIISFLLILLLIPLGQAFAIEYTNGTSGTRAEFIEGKDYISFRAAWSSQYEILLVFHTGVLPQTITLADGKLNFDTGYTYADISGDVDTGVYTVGNIYTDTGSYDVQGAIGGTLTVVDGAGNVVYSPPTPEPEPEPEPDPTEPPPSPEPEPEPDPTEPPSAPEDQVTPTPETENQDSLIDKLKCLLQDMFYWSIEKLLALIEPIIAFLIGLLPKTPFQFEPIQWGEFGQLIGYFLPVAKMLTHFTLLLIAIATYYGIRHLLRLLQTIK